MQKPKLRQCYVVELETPKGVLLNGIWLGPRRTRTVIVWVHGHGSSLFSKRRIMELIAKKGLAVLAFNNRGHDKISRIARAGGGKIRNTRLGGGAHEVFNECVDDIEGSVRFAKRMGARKIYLAGHSTGCQKSIYWAGKTGARNVEGIILLAPISDYAAESYLKGKLYLERAAKAARALVQRGQKHQLLPNTIWPEPIDAQRLISLYTPDSIEELFPYAQPDKRPHILARVRKPIFVVLAERDEFGDRPAKEIAEWFGENAPTAKERAIVKKAYHGFKGAEQKVASLILHWVNAH